MCGIPANGLSLPFDKIILGRLPTFQFVSHGLACEEEVGTSQVQRAGPVSLGLILSLLLPLSTTLAIYNRNPGSSGIFIIRDRLMSCIRNQAIGPTPSSVAATPQSQ